MKSQCCSMDPAELQVIRYELSILSGKDLSTVIVQKELYKDVMNALMTMKRDWAVVFFLYISRRNDELESDRILGSFRGCVQNELMRGRSTFGKNWRRLRKTACTKRPGI